LTTNLVAGQIKLSRDGCSDQSATQRALSQS
jgi:hypothetical protein